MTIDWAKMDGLLPAVVQDVDGGQLLMVGYMNEEALAKTQACGLVTFFSRSKQRLWTKGESSGHVMHFVAVQADCDGDALRVLARPTGPVCHLGTRSCFGEERVPALSFLAQLGQVIEGRANGDPDNSYTASLLQGSVAHIAQKVGEEGVEVALAAVAEDDAGVVGECADLLYHMMVLLRARGLAIEAVVDRLADRHRQP